MTEEGDGDLYHEIADLPKRLQARKLRSFALAGLYANRFAGQPREIIHREHRPQPQISSPAEPTASSIPASPVSTPAPQQEEAVAPAAPEIAAPVVESAPVVAAPTEPQPAPPASAGNGDALSMIDVSIMG